MCCYERKEESKVEEDHDDDAGSCLCKIGKFAFVWTVVFFIIIILKCLLNMIRQLSVCVLCRVL